MSEEKKPETEPHKKNSKKTVSALLPLFIIVFFLLLTLAIGYGVWVATGAAKGLVTQDANKKFIAQNTVAEKQKMQDALGWGSELLVDRKPGKPAKIRFMLRDKQKQPIKDAIVQMNFLHQKESGGQDGQTSVILSMAEQGVYRGEASLPQSGLWEVYVAVQIGKDTYQVSDKVALP